MSMVKIGMADLAVIKVSGILTTLGLGSCVGIALFDKSSKVAGLAHIMLPSSLEIKNNSNKAKFADTAIDLLVNKMLELGANKANIVAKIAGGSQMFSFNASNDILKIGQRNVRATKEKLKAMNIQLLSQDTGGNYGRTIEFNAENGSLYVRTIGHGTNII